MADLTVLDDVAHDWGADIQVTPTGDMARSNGTAKSRQRVLRRLLTNPGEYVFHPTYGAGLPARVGSIMNLPEIRALVRTQMTLEASVSQSDPITVTVVQIANGVSIDLNYLALPDKQPVSLSFDLSV